MPEVQATGDFPIRTADEFHRIGKRNIIRVEFGTDGIIVVINEEEGVTPGIVVETFEGGGHALTVCGEIIEDLDVGGSIEHSLGGVAVGGESRH